MYTKEIEEKYFQNGKYCPFKSERRRKEIQEERNSKKYGTMTIQHVNRNRTIIASPILAKEAIITLNHSNSIINTIFSAKHEKGKVTEILRRRS